MQQRRYFWLGTGYDANDPSLPSHLHLYRIILNEESGVSDFVNSYSNEERSAMKKKLRKLLLKSLCEYYLKQFVDCKLSNFISQMAVLYEIGLKYEAIDLLGQALKLARKQERYGFLLEVIGWEKQLNLILDKPTRSNKAILEEEFLIIKNLNQIVVLAQLFSATKEFKKTHGYVRGEMVEWLKKETIHSQGMPELRDCLSQRARHYFHFIHTLYNWMVIDPVQGYYHSRELVSSSIEVISPVDYIDGILENVTSCVCLCYFDEAIKWLTAAESHMNRYRLNQSKSFAARMASYNMCYLVEIFTYQGDRNRLDESILRAVNDLAIYANQLPKVTVLVIKANLMNAYICVGNMEKANEMWEQLFNRQNKNLRSDIYDDLYLFRLFRILQEGIYEVMPSVIRSAVRYYNNQPRFKVELEIMDILSVSGAMETAAKRKQTLSRVKDRISTQTQNLGVNKYQERFSFYKIWSESLVTGYTFAQCASKWYKKFNLIKEKVLKRQNP